MKPKYRILSNDAELSRYLAWNERITKKEALRVIMGWPQLRIFGSIYRIVPETEFRFPVRTKKNYETLAARIREASAFIQGRDSGNPNLWVSYAFVTRVEE